MTRLSKLLPFISALPLLQASIIPLQTPLRPFANHDDDTPLPLVIWHGLGDNYEADGLKSVAALAESTNPGTYVYLIRLGDSASDDRSATFFGNLTLQLSQICTDLSSHPILSTAPAIDALGFSQGGQFLRGYIERCNNPPVRSLVTFGSQHNGISEFQKCENTDWLCRGAQGLLRSNTWSDFVQSRLVPAQYFRDPLQYDDYLDHSNFLADINNERVLKNKTYKENLKKLEKFVMYLFEDDKTVIPKESGWFAEVNGTEVTGLRERELYKGDWLGLRELDGKGALEFKKTEGGHMSLSEELLVDVFEKYFGVLGRKFEDAMEEMGREDL